MATNVDNGNALLNILQNASIQSVSVRGRQVSIRFGTNDVRDLSEGQRPVVVVRCNRMADGTVEERQWGRAPTDCPKALKRRVREAGAGSVSRAVAQWVEIRAVVPVTPVVVP